MGKTLSRRLKYRVLATLVSALLVVLTLGISAAQAAIFHVRAPSTAPAGQGTSGWAIALTLALLAFVVVGIIYATLVERRTLTAAAPMGELAQLPVDASRQQERKAA